MGLFGFGKKKAEDSAVEMSEKEKLYLKQAELSEIIRKNYAKQKEDSKYLDAAIKACEEQIGIAKQVTKYILEGEKQYTYKTGEELLAEEGVPQNKYKGVKLPEGFNPGIHKSPDIFVVVPGKLGEHPGYKQLCIIRENQGNFSEVLRLAEQAKSEGWIGDWDKLIEKAKKNL